ncbi:uncharacterized membrane protein YgaE (UPF0421/DUF939 family) [Salsuginibacillus halophilus]|uniref:Uncharacterized membrane protein YgaE (UPF0421/DUF939 family) n=1 Tax=Salsuginibacillus halophilus TaxID=517424 RepID=A0A2P8HY02_9BACI|nr:aromatic acid exporter family protein [Salsuginibacillus halophilus]PSL51112.1 uncharacterized membrane protein YgaE (UPF0421/DUF939 family) [Salsuginibacillus halophilus]
MFPIGYRTIKTALGAALAVFLAQQLNLDFYASAGIITILCISVTKKDSLKASWERVVACLAGMLYAGVLFELFGYEPWVLALLILLFIPSMVKIDAKKGIVTSAVIMLHIYTFGMITPAVVLNELLLIAIGISVALVMNLYMPSVEHNLLEDQVRIEETFASVWKEYARFIREQETDWDGKELAEAPVFIEDGKTKALQSIENHVFRYDDYFYRYFHMREKQLEVLERTLPFVSTLDRSVWQGERIAAYMDRLGKGVHPGNTSKEMLQELADVKEELQQSELPQTREEFEVRSALYYILHEMEQYLNIKRRFKPDDERTETANQEKQTRRQRRKEKLAARQQR